MHLATGVASQLLYTQYFLWLHGHCVLHFRNIFFSFLLHFPFICCLSVTASIISHSLLVSLCAQAIPSLLLLCPSYLHRAFLLDLFPKQEDSGLLSVCNCSCNCLYKQKPEIPSMDPYH